MESRGTKAGLFSQDRSLFMDTLEVLSTNSLPSGNTETLLTASITIGLSQFCHLPHSGKANAFLTCFEEGNGFKKQENLKRGKRVLERWEKKQEQMVWRKKKWEETTHFTFPELLRVGRTENSDIFIRAEAIDMFTALGWEG